MQPMLGREERDQENFYSNSDTCTAYHKRTQFRGTSRSQYLCYLQLDSFKLGLTASFRRSAVHGLPCMIEVLPTTIRDCTQSEPCELIVYIFIIVTLGCLGTGC